MTLAKPLSSEKKTDKVAAVVVAAALKDKAGEGGGGQKEWGSKGLRKGGMLKVRLKECKAAGCLKKRMTIAFRMSLQQNGRAS